MLKGEIWAGGSQRVLDTSSAWVARGLAGSGEATFPHCHPETVQEPWVSSVQGERREGTRLLTTVPLIQAVGAVLDSVTSRDTQSIHRAEELSRAGWEPQEAVDEEGYS